MCKTIGASQLRPNDYSGEYILLDIDAVLYNLLQVKTFDNPTLGSLFVYSIIKMLC